MACFYHSHSEHTSRYLLQISLDDFWTVGDAKHFTISSYQDETRNGGDRVSHGSFLQFRQWQEELRPRHCLFLLRFQPSLFFLIHRTRDDLQLAGIVLCHLLHLWDGRTARATPRSPKVYQHHLAWFHQRRELHTLSILGLSDEVGIDGSIGMRTEIVEVALDEVDMHRVGIIRQ